MVHLSISHSLNNGFGYGGSGDLCLFWQERIVKLFEKNTYAVVNIFDVTLRPQLNVTGMMEVILCNFWTSYV